MSPEVFAIVALSLLHLVWLGVAIYYRGELKSADATIKVLRGGKK